MRFWIVFLCLLMALPVGCASVTKGKPTDEHLMKAVTSFNDALRWEDYGNAVLWVSPQMQDQFRNQTDRVKGELRLMEYEIRRVTRDETSLSGVVQVHYRYFRLTDPRVRTATLSQKWEFDEGEGLWRLTQPDLQVLLPGGL